MATKTNRPLAVAGFTAYVMLAACGHTDSFTNTETLATQPRLPAQPARLTWNPGVDLRPTYSQSGDFLTYSFDGPPADQSQCLGIMPATGGQRTGEICPWELEQNGRITSFGNSALSDDGWVLFSRHLYRFNTLATPSESGALYLAPMDSVAGARSLFALKAPPPGHTRVWDDLIGPTWLPDSTVVAVAGAYYVLPGCGSGGCPTDPGRYAGPRVALVGHTVVRIDPFAQPAIVTTIAMVEGVIGAALDRSTNTMYFAVHSYAENDFFREPIADSVFSMPLDGGPLTPIWGAHPDSLAYLAHLDGLSAANGRVFLSMSARSPFELFPFPSQSPFNALHSQVTELLPDGTLRSLAVAPLNGRWGNLSASPDGQRVAAELEVSGSSDIYLLSTAP